MTANWNGSSPSAKDSSQGKPEQPVSNIAAAAETTEAFYTQLVESALNNNILNEEL